MPTQNFVSRYALKDLTKDEVASRPPLERAIEGFSWAYFYNSWYPGESADGRRMIAKNFAKNPFKWEDILGSAGSTGYEKTYPAGMVHSGRDLPYWAKNAREYPKLDVMLDVNFVRCCLSFSHSDTQ